MASPSSAGTTTVPASPFFHPSFPNAVVVEQTVATPRGRHVRKRGVVVVATPAVKEHKSSLLGCVANLMTSIVGSGIVGLPYAMEQTGFVAGIGLILLTAILTEKSLRLILETAKHLHKQSYEATAEVVFGSWGFRFILVNMFVMAFGAMISYLMITKSCLAQILGLHDTMIRQFALLMVSSAIQFPLACMRDMADLEKSSSIAVAVDCTIVALVVASSPWIEMKGVEQGTLLDLIRNDTVHTGSVFMGLGVLSFAFECQESAFLVAGSLKKPTAARWAKVTSMALAACFFLAMVCAVTGYLGYGSFTKGNILDNLDPSSTISYAGHGMLGITMFATYPLASFVARHVCVVLLFEGRQAHEGGSDSSILNRADRRIMLTLALFMSALVPATLSSDMGSVLAIAGVIGASSLAYIGPGMLYLSVHGGRFLQLMEDFFFIPSVRSDDPEVSSESTSLISVATRPQRFDGVGKALLWYLGGFPLWSRIAEIGKVAVVAHARKLASDNTMESLRIGDVDHTPIEKLADMSSAAEPRQPKSTSIHGAPNGSLSHLIHPRSDRNLEKMINNQNSVPASMKVCQVEEADTSRQSQSLEPDPQEAPPSWQDFVIAIFYICFGVLALSAGLLSLGG